MGMRCRKADIDRDGGTHTEKRMYGAEEDGEGEVFSFGNTEQKRMRKKGEGRRIPGSGSWLWNVPIQGAVSMGRMSRELKKERRSSAEEKF